MTLDGQVINAGGSFTGGSAQKSAGVITRKNEIDELDTAIESLSAERDKLKVNAEKLRAESEKLRFDSEAVKSEIAQNDADAVRINAEISTLNSLITQTDSQSENSGKLISDIEQKIESSKQTIEDSEKSLAETEEEIRTEEDKLAQGKDFREKLRSQRAELSEKLSALKIKSIEYVKDTQAQELEIQRIAASLSEIEHGSQVFHDEINRQNDIISHKQIEIDRLKEKLAGFKDNTASYNEQILRYQSMHSEQNKLVNELNKGLKQFNEAKEKISREITMLEERREARRRDNDFIRNQLHDVYELTLSEAVELAEKIEDMNAAQQELNNVKNQIKRLGSVNVDAIEEYREVSERYEFMSGQIADVQKSKSELEKLIAGLTEDMCRIFSESFAIINSNFKEIFVELFGGGKAELILTDPENVLESGIEISVAPPGKVIKNLISLSGGEQSFVAIAIYFSILRLRPAPFCILDEIDAALDEVNVRKYAQYLKKFTDTTQFVLVPP